MTASTDHRPHTAVIGAGVVGLLSAWQLRLAGHAVTVIAPDAGRDASYAAAGMLAPVSEVQYGQDELWPLMAASRAEYPGFLATLARAVETPTGYRENGTILLAADRSDRDAVADLVDVQQAHGMEVAPLSSRELRSREPSLAPGLAKAWDVPSDHQVDPRQLLRCTMAALNADLGTSGRGSALAADFPDVGPPVTWVQARAVRVDAAPESADADTSASGVGTPASAYTVTLEDGQTVTAEKVLIAPGLGYPEIAGLPEAAPLRLRPVYGDVLRLRGEPGTVQTTVRAKVRGRSVYLVPRGPESTDGDGGVVVGASSREDGLAGTHAGSVQELLDDAVAVLPGLKDMELVEITTRARPGTPDDRPYLGALAGHSGVVVSTGFSRHGILLAPLAARLSAALLNSEKLGERDAAMLESMALDRVEHSHLSRRSP
ncbi:FAD-dependent oxidoreductase [Nesterenkonia lacusekhoensis]|uniref:Glycine oxidase n=1 Tax=Nesterenkonia lacusekhoensis TaxID=150832 RepID=A0ABS4T499_9MICC|nr:FAD-dependent oxidoreductase [Nesterenkonia lacusekhoensis]MBP2319279.1 glycine oxidase [Nesterenkonia lacusekhoensis]